MRATVGASRSKTTPVAKKILNERQAAQKAPIKVAKQMQSALKKWESLNPKDAEVALEILLGTDFYDRTYAMLDDAKEVYIKRQ
jgi:hypothetical protein